MLVPIGAKSPYAYRRHHTGMGTHTCMVIIFRHRTHNVTKVEYGTFRFRKIIVGIHIPGTFSVPRSLTLTPEACAGAVAISLSVPFPERFYACHLSPDAIFDQPNLCNNIVDDQRPKKYWTNLKRYSPYYPVI